jgi:LmbE family N-acetylglucosaminyl deacetylase
MKLNERADVVQGKKDIFTDLAIAAHQDDIEIMCPQAIIRGYQSQAFGLVAVVTADGAGSARAGKYANVTDKEMRAIRKQEQVKAAELGDYSVLIQLDYNSAQIKDSENEEVVNDYIEILKEYQPTVVYTHNLADKHATHVAVAKKCIKAIRSLPKEERPLKLYGCEVWRGLDWLSDDEKVVFDLTGFEEVLNKLVEVYDSQIAGGKRYDKASTGRRIANATYAASHSVDQYESAAYAMDLTPLIEDDSLDIKEFIVSKIKLFIDEILV